MNAENKKVGAKDGGKMGSRFMVLGNENEVVPRDSVSGNVVPAHRKAPETSAPAAGTKARILEEFSADLTLDFQIQNNEVIPALIADSACMELELTSDAAITEDSVLINDQSGISGQECEVVENCLTVPAPTSHAPSHALQTHQAMTSHANLSAQAAAPHNEGQVVQSAVSHNADTGFMTVKSDILNPSHHSIVASPRTSSSSASNVRAKKKVDNPKPTAPRKVISKVSIERKPYGRNPTRPIIPKAPDKLIPVDAAVGRLVDSIPSSEIVAGAAAVGTATSPDN